MLTLTQLGASLLLAMLPVQEHGPSPDARQELAKSYKGLGCHNDFLSATGLRAGIRVNRPLRSDFWREDRQQDGVDVDHLPPEMTLSWLTTVGPDEQGRMTSESYRTETFTLDHARFVTFYTAGALGDGRLAALGADASGAGVLELFEVIPSEEQPEATRLPGGASRFDSVGTLDFETAYGGALAGSLPIAVGPFLGHPGWAVALTVPDGRLFALDLRHLSTPNLAPEPPRVLLEEVGPSVCFQKFSTASSTFGTGVYVFGESVRGCGSVCTLVYTDADMDGELVLSESVMGSVSYPPSWGGWFDPSPFVATLLGAPAELRRHQTSPGGPPNPSHAVDNLDMLSPMGLSPSHAEIRRHTDPSKLELVWQGFMLLDTEPTSGHTQVLSFTDRVETWASGGFDPADGAALLFVQLRNDERDVTQLLRLSIQVPSSATGGSAAGGPPLRFEPPRTLSSLSWRGPRAQDRPVAMFAHPTVENELLMLLGETSSLIALRFTERGPTFSSVLTHQDERALSWRFDALRTVNFEGEPRVQFLSQTEEGALEPILHLGPAKYDRLETKWKRDE